MDSWHRHFGRNGSTGEHGAGVHGICKVCTGPLCKVVCSAAGKTPAHARLDGVDGGSGQQKSGQVGHVINDIDGEYSCCASSHRCSCIWARGGRENSTCQQCCSWRSLCPSEFSD